MDDPAVLLPTRSIRTTRNIADLRQGRRDWFKVQNRAGEEARIDIFDEIGFFGVTFKDFEPELRAITAPSISLHLHSPGGDVDDGIAIYNALVHHPASIHVTVDGMALSIASVIAMAGDRVTMSLGSMMMVHEPWAMTIGGAKDMRKAAAALDAMGESIASIYAARAGGEAEDWLAVMAEETWYTADEAVAAGLADKVSTVPAMKNRWDLTIFRNAPRWAPNERDTRPGAGLGHGASDDGWQTRAHLQLIDAMEGLYAVTGRAS